MVIKVPIFGGILSLVVTCNIRVWILGEMLTCSFVSEVPVTVINMCF